MRSASSLASASRASLSAFFQRRSCLLDFLAAISRLFQAQIRLGGREGGFGTGDFVFVRLAVNACEDFTGFHGVPLVLEHFLQTSRHTESKIDTPDIQMQMLYRPSLIDRIVFFMVGPKRSKSGFAAAKPPGQNDAAYLVSLMRFIRSVNLAPYLARTGAVAS